MSAKKRSHQFHPLGIQTFNFALLGCGRLAFTGGMDRNATEAAQNWWRLGPGGFLRLWDRCRRLCGGGYAHQMFHSKCSTWFAAKCTIRRYTVNEGSGSARVDKVLAVESLHQVPDGLNGAVIKGSAA